MLDIVIPLSINIGTDVRHNLALQKGAFIVYCLGFEKAKVKMDPYVV